MADTEKIIRKKYDVPIWHKSNLTIDEAVERKTEKTNKPRRMPICSSYRKSSND